MEKLGSLKRYFFIRILFLIVLFFTSFKEGVSMEVSTEKYKENSLNLSLEISNINPGKECLLTLKFENKTSKEINIVPIYNFTLRLLVGKSVDSMEDLGTKFLFKKFLSEGFVKVVPVHGLTVFKETLTSDIYDFPRKGPFKVYVIYENVKETIGKYKLWKGKVVSNAVSYEF